MFKNIITSVFMSFYDKSSCEMFHDCVNNTFDCNWTSIIKIKAIKYDNDMKVLAYKDAHFNKLQSILLLFCPASRRISINAFASVHMNYLFAHVP